MKIVNVHDAKTNLSRLLNEVENGEEVVIARHGKPVATLRRVTTPIERTPGALRDLPAWANWTYEPAVFAPMTEEEMQEEGWP